VNNADAFRVISNSVSSSRIRRRASASSDRSALDKPVEFVLPTHGEPADHAALERALA
jgi:hypothetical protein